MNKEKELIKAIINISRHVVYLALVMVFCMAMIIILLFIKPATNGPVAKAAITFTATITRTKSVTSLLPEHLLEAERHPLGIGGLSHKLESDAGRIEWHLGCSGEPDLRLIDAKMPGEQRTAS